MKVLQIAVGINGGGVGAVLLNFYTHMNHNDVKFDIIIDDLPSVKNGSLNEDAFKKMGCNIFRVTPKSQNLSENIRQVSEIMKTAITIFSTQIWRNGRRCTASSAKNTV